jgi:hypothetical protein
VDNPHYTPILKAANAKVVLAILMRCSHPGIAISETYEVVGRHLQARLRAGHRIEAARLAVSLRPRRSLAEDQEPGGASSEARGLGTARPTISTNVLGIPRAQLFIMARKRILDRLCWSPHS